MVAGGSRIEGGGTTQFISPRLRKTIQSIKEIVGNHSDADIYVALKETNMDPNETAQKLLNQDPFHEVKRKRDKKKEVTGYKGSISVEPRKAAEQVGQDVKPNTLPDRDRNAYSDRDRNAYSDRDRNAYSDRDRNAYSDRDRNTYSDRDRKPYSDRARNVRRGGYSRNIVPGVTREFRVVKDNRITQTADKEIKPPSVPSSTPANDPSNGNISQKSSTGTYKNQKPPAGHQSSQHLNGPIDSRVRQATETGSSGTDRNAKSAEKQNDSLSNSVVGVYSSSSDPVHVPSLDSRQAANVGAIKREVGAVGARRKTSENSSKIISGQASSLSNTRLGRDGSSRETSRSFTAISKRDQVAQTSVAESAVPIMSTSKPLLNNQYNNRSHQQVASHQKAPQPNKEWKPKSSKKTSTDGPGVIGMPTKSAPSVATNPKDLSAEADQLPDKLSRTNIHENQNVIIAANIRVSETDRCRLRFGSLGTEDDSLQSAGFQPNVSTESSIQHSASVLLSPPESSSDDASVSKQVESLDVRARSSGSISPPSGGASEHQLTDIGLVRDSTPSYAPSVHTQQQQDSHELQNFAAYDSQGSYDMPYFRSAVDESVRGQVLSIPQEAMVSHSANVIPASSIAMLQQQQQAPMAQMYSPVHISHYAMPYRQFLSPMYIPPIAAMPGYSNNPAAAYSPHPSNGSSYLLMPGANSPHLNANGLKYGIQQFKPVPTNPTGFGNFTSPTGYAINTPGIVGNAAGLDDSSRLKYKDGNLYVPNPQAETSELWMNPRDIPSMQSASYYNMTAQTPHAAYMQSHTGHPSFNAAAPQSSHMQFPGMYHPQPPPAALANPHHMGGNVGVGVAAGAPGAPVGAYQHQQSQLGHVNWSGNF